VIVFHKLSKGEIKVIVELVLNRLRGQIGEHDVTIELTDEAKDLLVEKGYDPAMGARPLRRAIQRYIEDPLADFVLGANLTAGSTILVARKNDDEVDISIIPGAPPVEAKVTVPPDEPETPGEDDSEDAES
jgi:ATP-dependent Clp protease ATP-binding subunit ClpC